MAAKAILVLCALAQVAFGQYLGGIGSSCGCDAAYGAGLGGYGAGYGAFGAGYGGIGAGYGAGFSGIGAGYGAIAPLAGVAPASGGGLPIASASPIPPSGLSVASENAIEGILAVAGDMPFVSAVALEGALPTAGAGSVVYGCGDGSIGIVRADVAPALDVADGFAYGAGLAAPALGLATPALGLAAPALGLGGAGFGLAAPARGFAAPAYRGCGCGAVY